ncbi:MAG: TIGR01906 family membrane protein [Chloroflexi bacterium]|nr:TIGR01906 family membrane protein [Chloroflexota bacterium]
MRLSAIRSTSWALFIIAIPVLLITSNIRIAANEPRVYDYSVGRYDAAEVAGIPEGELKRANRELIRYFNDDEQRTIRVVVKDDLGRDVSLFTPRETAHLADVKALFQKVFFVQLAALIYVMVFVVAVFLWAREAPLQALATALARSTLVTVALAFGVGIGALVGFDRLWNQFHVFAFANDFWQLDPSRHHLIQMFPRDFWLDLTLFIGLGTLIETLLIAGLAIAYLYFTRPRTGPSDQSPSLLSPVDRLTRLERLSRQIRSRQTTSVK